MTDPFSAPPDRPAESWGPPPWAAKSSGPPAQPVGGASAAFVPPSQPAHQPPGPYQAGPYAPPSGAPWPGPAGYGLPLRHPLDPDVRTSTKAGGVLLLGITAIVLMFCVGGIVPAVLGLVLARGARRELADARGFLGGDGMLRAGTAMSWIALTMSLLILFGAAIIALIAYGTDAGPHFGTNVD